MYVNLLMGNFKYIILILIKVLSRKSALIYKTHSDLVSPFKQFTTRLLEFFANLQN